MKKSEAPKPITPEARWNTHPWDLMSSNAARALTAGERWATPADEARAVAWAMGLPRTEALHLAALLEAAGRSVKEATDALEGKYDGWYHPDRVSLTDLRYAVVDKYDDIRAMFEDYEEAQKYAKKCDRGPCVVNTPARAEGDYFEIVGLRA